MRKISNVLRAASCCTFSLLMCLPTAGQDAWSQADCVTLLDSTAVTVEPNGSGSFAVYRSFRVQTPKGAVNNHVIKYDYDPLTAFARFKQVTLQRANGETVQVDVTKTCDYAAPARAIYWGARQIMIELGSLEPGDTVSYEISKKGFTYALLAGGEDDDTRFIPPMRGQFYDIVPFWVDQPTRRKVYTVSMPMEKELQFQFYNGACASSMRYEDGRKVYTFAKNEVLPFGREPNMVDLFDEAPKLMMSSTPRWEDKSLWFHDLNDACGSFDALPEAQQKVNELIKGKKTEMEKIAVLTHWVADNIRYAGISMGEGEGFTLHNTKMNYTDRCGVCKDIAGTLISFLRMAGFRGLSGDDDGGKPHREHSGRSFQPLRGSGEVGEWDVYPSRSYLGAVLPRAVEQRRTATELSAGHSGRFRFVPDSRVGSRKPLRAHRRRK